MSLQEILAATRRQAVLQFCLENPNKSFTEYQEDLDSDCLEALMDLCPADFQGGGKASSKKKDRSATSESGSSRAPRRSTEEIVSVLEDWRDSCDAGENFSMGEVCAATGLSASQVRKGFELIEGIERQGERRNTVYVVTPQNDDDDDLDDDLDDDDDDGEVAAQ